LVGTKKDIQKGRDFSRPFDIFARQVWLLWVDADFDNTCLAITDRGAGWLPPWRGTLDFLLSCWRLVCLYGFLQVGVTSEFVREQINQFLA